jgi:hypothetical protein
MSTSYGDDLLERVERLERANRGWKSTAIVACLAVIVLSIACGAAFSQRQPQSEPARGAATAGTQQPSYEAGVPIAAYGNFCRVSGTPEEVIFDFGVAIVGTGEEPAPPIQRTSRIAMNFYTLKRLIPALQTTLDRHEKAYGPVEIDAQKRALPGTVQ